MPSNIFLKNKQIFADAGKLFIVGQFDAQFANSMAAAYFWGDNYLASVKGEPAYMPPYIADVEALLIMLPKSRIMLSRLLLELSQNYAGKTCFLIGANSAGIKGAARQFTEFCAGANKLDSARHCQLWQATLPSTKDYQVIDFCEFFECKTNKQSLQLCSLAGVFNHGGIDAGTQLLLNYLQTAKLNNPARILDFGCGSGVLGIYLKLQNPNSQVDLLDISKAAIYSSQQSAALNQVAINTINADGIGALAQKYDLIISNPPFHTGVAADYSISADFFKNAKLKLDKNGTLIIVANRFLQYQQQLQQCFGNCIELGGDKKFVLLQAKHN